MNTLRWICEQLRRALTKLLILSVLWPQSCLVGLRSLSKKDNLFIEKEYEGQKILLIALFQKGILRNDLKKLLSTAKQLGFYIIGVNTLTLSEDVSDIFDCYIERFNFGRDFGSYKAGFNYIFNKGIHLQCPRLLMCNDSVYYEATRCKQFLVDLMDSPIEVLGATENYEVNYHLGSFCIAMAGRILSQDKFKHFWEKYKNSEIRPRVIFKGEMALSSCLKQLVTNPENLCALYDMTRISKIIANDDAAIKAAFILARQSQRVHWPTLSFDREEIVKMAKNHLSMTEKEAIALSEQTAHFLKTTSPSLSLDSDVRQFLSAKILEVFRVGSQIHQNNAFLQYLGMPLVKLDGFYRGPFDEEDVLIITQNLPAQEANELQTLLFSKGYGFEVLFNWKLFLYRRGYL